MSEKEFYKPVGGVLSAELFPIGELQSIEDAVAGGGIAVELVDDGSTYEERFEQQDRLVGVRHTLTLCSDRKLAQEWFSVELMQRLSAEGAVARVLMATGEQITVGYSPRFGFEQAMRLESLSFSSGERPQDSPKVCLRLQSKDLTSALK